MLTMPQSLRICAMGASRLERSRNKEVDLKGSIQALTYLKLSHGHKETFVCCEG